MTVEVKVRIMPGPESRNMWTTFLAGKGREMGFFLEHPEGTQPRQLISDA